MYLINQPDPPSGFQAAWNAGGYHLQHQVQDHISWLRTQMFKPFIEHLSFRLGNQIFWVFLELEDRGNQILPFAGEAKQLFLNSSKNANVHPCLFPMERWAQTWKPKLPGWGLKHAVSGALIDPLKLVTDELIEMSEWEIHDLAVQIVRTHLEDQGKQIDSYCSYQEIDPSIWFRDEKGPHWVVVRESVYPNLHAAMPQHIDDIAKSVARGSPSGFFAAVGLANDEDEFQAGASALPLYRGHGVFVKFSGLERIECR